LYSLDKKLAVITGGTSGIGLAVARNFVACGATVVITGRRDSGAEIADDIGADFLRCDVTQEEQIVSLFANIIAKHGAIDILVANAGLADDEGSIADYPTEDMRRLLDINLTGVFMTLKHATEHLRDGASVIATGSAAGAGTSNPGAGVYAASKAGVAYLMRTAALELAPRGIRANTVCPALIADTGMMTADDGGDEARLLGCLTAFGRMGRLDEVVGIYNFLAGSGATFITGQEIRVDGGLTAGIGGPLMGAVSDATSR